MAKKMSNQDQVVLLQKQKAALLEEARQCKTRINDVDKQIREAEDQIKREKAKRDKFPPGFAFGFNNRRGDPNYTPYWYCTLKHGSEEVWSCHWSEEDCTEKQARARAIDSAWKLVDIAEAIMEAGRKDG